jgi:hypothetical protein
MTGLCDACSAFNGTSEIRAAVKEISGGNSTWADDDLDLLKILSLRAILAGLSDDIPEPTRGRMRATAESLRAGVEQAYGKAIPNIAGEA